MKQDETAFENSATQTTAPDEPPRTMPFVFPVICFGFAFITAVDLCAIELGRLGSPGIDYPTWLHLTPIVVPGFCAMVWLRARHTHPQLGWIIPVMVCFTLIFAVPAYVARHIARIPITRQLTPTEIYDLEAKLDIHISASSSGRGDFVIVAPEHERLVREELSRLKVARP